MESKLDRFDNPVIEAYFYQRTTRVISASGKHLPGGPVGESDFLGFVDEEKGIVDVIEQDIENLAVALLGSALQFRLGDAVENEPGQLPQPVLPRR